MKNNDLYVLYAKGNTQVVKRPQKIEIKQEDVVESKPVEFVDSKKEKKNKHLNLTRNEHI